MSLYSKYLFPLILESVMTQKAFIKPRRETLSPVKGRVLEIGFGTGVNLHHYPNQVKKLVTLDTNPAMHRRAQERVRETGIEVEHHTLSAERLPFDGASFDYVVSTLTLCSIPDVQKALKEIRRVLKLGGELVFLEHGLSREPHIARWQHRIDPAWRLVGDGCHLNRDASAEVQQAGLKLTRIRNFYLPRTAKIAGYMYLGAAQRED
jgi:ubiquinone/menaquinone biosynthesis C-methylase UbiE